jgi:CHAT domain-containing protein
MGLERVGASLPDGCALVAYAKYERCRDADSISRKAPTPGGPQEEFETDPSYVALVLPGAHAEPILVDLGKAAAIDSMVGRWCAEMSRGAQVPARFLRESRARELGLALRERVWDPVARRIGGATRIFVVPDASLNLVNLAALPDGDRQYLAETGPTLHLLATERDLVPPGRAPPPGEGLLALGGAVFGGAERPGELPPLRRDTPAAGSARAAPDMSHPDSGEAPASRGAASDCAAFRDLRWADLPGTRRECDDITRLWRQSGATGTVQSLTGDGADEKTFKADAPGRRVLHLATHGFFLSGRCNTTLAGGPAGSRSASGGDLSTQVENPLLLSGLALAGANLRMRAAPDQEDGVLTADEVSSLDLSSAEWVVLSACETGVGEVRAGEGVFGLRRAFQVAGAHTLIMSLWSVEDEAARRWMEVLYGERLSRHQDTAEAVRAATLAVLRERRAKGQSTHPFYWGAFVAAGDWR